MAEFTHESILNENLPSEFDLEKFLSYVSVESACQWNTGEQFDEHGSQFFSLFKRWIAQAIYKFQRKAVPDFPAFYHQFPSLLANSIVFTFNWDTLLETLLEMNSVPYELDSRSNLDLKKVSIFKLHGSIDWFSLPTYKRRSWMSFEELGDSMKGLYRAGTRHVNLDEYFKAHMTPWIILPCYDKINQLLQFGNLWSLLYMFLQNELEVIIIGFSMRDDDYHSRAIFYPQLVQGSKDGYVRIKVIDLAQTIAQKECVMNRFRGIGNSHFWFDGFSEKAIEFIENS